MQSSGSNCAIKLILVAGFVCQSFNVRHFSFTMFLPLLNPTLVFLARIRVIRQDGLCGDFIAPWINDNSLVWKILFLVFLNARINSLLNQFDSSKFAASDYNNDALCKEKKKINFLWVELVLLITGQRCSDFESLTNMFLHSVLVSHSLLM